MSNPKVSVIIPTLNRADFIKESINSVLSQTYQDFEIIVIDDGSTDNTREIVEGYDNEKIKYFYQKNSGLNSARNTGIRNSKGEYISYLDSDDIWHPYKLEKQVAILDKNSDIGLVYCGSSLIDENGTHTGKRPLIRHSGYVFEKLIRYNFLYNGSIAIFRRNCLEKVGLFDERTVRMTDWEFYLRFAIHYKFYGIPEYLIKYRVHQKTMSNDFKLFLDSGFKIIDKTFEIFDIKIRTEAKTLIESIKLRRQALSLKQTAYAMRYRYAGRRYFDKDLFEDAREYYQRALKEDFRIIFYTDTLPIYFLSFFSQDFVSNLRNLKFKLSGGAA
jgi:glycosyltransferase involved in cell wall biosynthesis